MVFVFRTDIIFYRMDTEESQSEEVLKLKTGEGKNFEISFASHYFGGYSWHWETDGNFICVKNNELVQTFGEEVVNGEIVGGPAVESFSFQAADKKGGKIIFSESRSFEPETRPIRIVTVEVEVQERNIELGN